MLCLRLAGSVWLAGGSCTPHQVREFVSESVWGGGETRSVFISLSVVLVRVESGSVPNIDTTTVRRLLHCSATKRCIVYKFITPLADALLHNHQLSLAITSARSSHNNINNRQVCVLRLPIVLCYSTLNR